MDITEMKMRYPIMGEMVVADIIIDALSEEWMSAWEKADQTGDTALKNYAMGCFYTLDKVFHTTPTCVDHDNPMIEATRNYIGE